MSDASTQRKTKPVRRQRSIYQVHYGLPRVRDENMATPLPLPTDPASLQAYTLQVAGHMSTQNNKYLGVLQCNNGTILKPIIKESQKREIDFYTRLSTSNLPDLVELRQYTPTYYGCRRFTYNGHEQEYIVLENLCDRMLEPCIMDVKIGKRTWDPLATEEKILSEQNKYRECKQQLGFCIPGYQVHSLPGGKLLRFGKDHGKRLHGHMVVAAIRKFLNGTTFLCRSLVLALLSRLWKIQRWAARQRSLKLYSASLLLVYDAARLRDCCPDNDTMLCRAQPAARRASIHSISPDAGSNFSGQLTAKGPTYKRVNAVPISPLSLAHSSFTPPSPIHSPWTEALDKLHHNHSFDHNYEDKLSKIKMNYRAQLEQLSDDTPTPNPWGTVKIIDFAHAFFNEDDQMGLDENFKEGIDNFVAIFEEFLRETDDQVF
ncbi:inositol polyphosphate multikinase [Pectinophora gossypiella]|uniref:Kinase n=1 Tax=Pectinophora gossypiella TaxID=13191 RepID=A0A1E1WFJ8_PECGO|nr:inositol polyphosphate multikinase [Pectinophora gossypiella]XP_049876125.1 inositol polyphosphate multikinase [Pectinophora gossypiella]XP_049876126.1 inositol polyphosphate multikinase [Pectinophora gossypiella]XP_049876127.1 inositol polyphosphate multikinase [Pectinophora gossypiella]